MSHKQIHRIEHDNVRRPYANRKQVGWWIPSDQSATYWWVVVVYIRLRMGLRHLTRRDNRIRVFTRCIK